MYLLGNLMTDYAAKAKLFHILSLENRLRIVDELRYGDACVCHLQHKLKKPQAYVSQQLRILKDEDVVNTDRDGVNIFYRLVDPLARQLVDLALGPIDAQRPVDPSCPCPRCAGEGRASTT
jgi:ArsR family transcriptional regulator